MRQCYSQNQTTMENGEVYHGLYPRLSGSRRERMFILCMSET